MKSVDSKNKNSKLEDMGLFQASNPLSSQVLNTDSGLANYSQSMKKPKYDNDIIEVIETVRVLNNLAPLRMPIYNFNAEEINGEQYNKPDGTPLLIREWDSDLIRDYYLSSDAKIVSRILEHDKNTGRLRTKIEPNNRDGRYLKINITIFDEKINNKYTLMQLSEGGIVNNITEFTGKGKSFQSLFRDIHTFKPVRYLEGKDDKEHGFIMLDCIFGLDGNVARIKRYTNKKEIDINYTKDCKNISVRTKSS
jgi:hypothetical protein